MVPSPLYPICIVFPHTWNLPADVLVVQTQLDLNYFK